MSVIDEAVNAEYRLEVAWSNQVDNAFAFGTSTLGGGDELVNSFTVDFEGDYDDVSDDVANLQIDRGRDDPLSDIQAGKMDFILFDLDGKYNPEETSSPLYGQLTPMRQAQLVATYDGVDYPLFRGFIRSLMYDPLKYETSIHCEDLFLWLDRIKPVIPSMSGTTGECIRATLIAAGWDQEDLIDVPVDQGDDVGAYSLNGEEDARTALQGIADLLEAEQGIFFITGGGVATYRDRHYQAAAESAVTLSDQFINTRPGADIDGMINVATVTKLDGVPQVAEDDASRQFYGPSSVEITSPYFETDEQALALAGYLVFRFKDPQNPVWAMPMIANVEDSVMVALLDAELGDRVTIDSPHAGVDGDYYIESIEHAIDVASMHQVNWSLSKRPEADNEVFVLGESTLGGGDILAYY